MNNIGVYEGLQYTSFAVAQTAAGLDTHTPPNLLVSGFEQTDVTGELAGFEITGTTKRFDLISFYYSCAVNSAEGAVAVPQQCTFEARGYKTTTDANPSATQTFTFNPVTGNLEQQQSEAILTWDFKDLEKVDFVMVESASGEQLNVLDIDSTTYTLYDD